MPLRSGTSKQVRSGNISELMHSYGASGKIGNINPKNKKHAAKIAAAIAFDKSRQSAKKR